MTLRRAAIATLLAAGALVVPRIGEGQEPVAGTLLLATFAGPTNCSGPARPEPARSRQCLMKPVRAVILIERVGDSGPATVARTRLDGRAVAVLTAGEYVVRPLARPRRRRERVPDVRRITVAGGGHSDVIFDYTRLFPPG
ncbi:MAG TPA: hypothetical protein VF549_20990 [Solirubrobacteraceae bacterium]|jgi:hypothetical protein